MNLTAILAREDFNTACLALSQEDADTIAETYPHMFSGYFTYNARAADAPVKPAPAKPREPKPPVAVIAPAALDAEVLAVLAKTPNVRAETLAASSGLDGRKVLRSLTRLVKAGKVYKDGEHRGARYKVAVPRAEPEGTA